MAAPPAKKGPGYVIKRQSQGQAGGFMEQTAGELVVHAKIFGPSADAT